MYDDLTDLLIELSMERDNYPHTDNYLFRHLQRETPAERNPGGGLSQPQPNPGQCRDAQLKHMQKTPLHMVKGSLMYSMFYYLSADGRGEPCHAPECDGGSACMLQLPHKQKTNDCQGVKHQDHFSCTITCRYRFGRRHYDDECQPKRRKSKKRKKGQKKSGGRPVRVTPIGKAVEVTLMNEDGTQLHPPVGQDPLTLLPRGSSRARSKLHIPSPSTDGAEQGKNAKKASSTGSLSACGLPR